MVLSGAMLANGVSFQANDLIEHCDRSRSGHGSFVVGLYLLHKKIIHLSSSTDHAMDRANIASRPVQANG